jgi:methionyl aminopeptidase
MKRVGRNEPCPCGSGSKYKRCCGSITAEERLATDFLEHPPIAVKTPEEIEGMRRAGRLAARILAEACAAVEPGLTTDAIDALVHARTLEAGAYPSPLNYPNPPTDPHRPTIGRRGFPRSVCTSVNDVICHGIPDATALAEGDILNIDVTVTLDGFHGDTSRTVYVGRPSEEARTITETARECMERGIAACREGALFYDIGDAIQSLAESRGFSVVRDFTGHGIGREFHEPPAVLHYRDTSLRFPMRAGNVFTIEPMINAGSWQARIDPEDNWTARTIDGSLSAQFEHTILVTADGFEILTAAPD